MTDAVGAVSNTGTQTRSISSIKDLENNPEFFPLWVAEMQRQNLNVLFSAFSSSPDDSSNDALGSYFGTSGSESTDIFAALGLSSSTTNSLGSLFSTQGITSDFSFLTPSMSLQSFQVEETLRGLQAYTNATETQRWLGVMVEYADPTDSVLKTGKITRVDIENVAKPLFRIDDKINITLDDIKAFGTELAANTNTEANQQKA